MSDRQVQDDDKRVQRDIATAEVIMPALVPDIAWRVHGALCVTNEMPVFRMIHGASLLGRADGATEVHKVTVARQGFRYQRPSEGAWPTEWIPGALDAALAKRAEHLERQVGDL